MEEVSLLGIQWMNAWQDKVSCTMYAVVSVRLVARDHWVSVLLAAGDHRVSVRRLPAGDQSVPEVALEVTLDSHYHQQCYSPSDNRSDNHGHYLRGFSKRT